jgi:DNA end-binding protein Ku
MARQLVESLAGDFDSAEYRNSYRDELRAMLDAKLKGQEIVSPEPVPEAPVIDLMEALRQSVAAASDQKPTARKRKAKTA